MIIFTVDDDKLLIDCFILYSNKIDMGPVCDHVDNKSLGQI